MGRKPDDRKAVPLCFWHHLGGPEAQHSMSEEKFWASHGLDPFKIAANLYKEYGGSGGKPKPPQKIKERKPKEKRAKVSSSKTQWPRRALRSRAAWPQRKKGRVPDL